jgi:adenine phosphoribosyltransferase
MNTNICKVLLIDDVLATGGTISAAIDLIQRIGGEVVHVLALLEISGLSGRQKIGEVYPEVPITTFLVS